MVVGAADNGAKKYPIYAIDGMERELRQGEIIGGLSQWIYDTEAKTVQATEHAFSVILTQDCDLLWDYESRQKGEDSSKLLNSVLLYATESAVQTRAKVKGSDLWRRIISNNNERYHLLEGVPAELDLGKSGLGPLTIDFKSFFTLTPDDICKQCAGGTAKRRCRLEMPYREHLQCRAAFYFQRVTLPVPHNYSATPTA